MGKIKKILLVLAGGDPFTDGHNKGYAVGLDEGSDFGKRIAYNQTLTKELPRILSRYAQVQVKVINKPKFEIQKALEAFTAKEIDRFKMELQNR